MEKKIRCEKEAWEVAGEFRGRGDARMRMSLGQCPDVHALVCKVLRATNPDTILAGTLQTDPDYPLDAFLDHATVDPKIGQWLSGGCKKYVLIFSGKGGLGKTEFSCALMKIVAPAGWHFINRFDRLKDIVWMPGQGLVVDEICLREFDIDDTKAALDLEKTRDLKCRNKDGCIPKGTPRILCTNWRFETFWPDAAFLPEHENAIKRRHAWVAIARDLRVGCPADDSAFADEDPYADIDAELDEDPLGLGHSFEDFE